MSSPNTSSLDVDVPAVTGIKHPFNSKQLRVLAAAVNTVFARQTEQEIEEILAALPIDVPDVRGHD